MSDVMVFVEVPSGSRNKYELDAATGHIVLDRRLFTSMSYPADYGFVEGTLGEDGDPLDALCLVGEPTFPGCRIRARVVGVFHMTGRERARTRRSSASQLKDPSWMRVHDVHDIQPELRNEIEHFFQVYKDLEAEKVETRGFGNRAEAEVIVGGGPRTRLSRARRRSARRQLEHDGPSVGERLPEFAALEQRYVSRRASRTSCRRRGTVITRTHPARLERGSSARREPIRKRR
jgi:inorganic pyrophosphatase